MEWKVKEGVENGVPPKRRPCVEEASREVHVAPLLSTFSSGLSERGEASS